MTSHINIIVDGIQYEVEHTPDGPLERIVLWSEDHQLIGDVAIDHNIQQARADVPGTEGPLDYFDIAERTPVEIGTWIAAVAEPQDNSGDDQPDEPASWAWSQST